MSNPSWALLDSTVAPTNGAVAVYNSTTHLWVPTNPIHVVSIQVTDPAGSALTVADGQAYFRVPVTVTGCNLVGVAAHVTTVSSSGIPTVQLHNLTDTNDMLTTKLTVDASELDSSTAATAAVIDTSKDDVVTADIIRVDVDVAGTGTKGLIVEMRFQLP